MKKRSLIDLIFTPVAYFIPVVFAVSCSKNIPAGSGNQNVCVTRLAPKVGEVGVSGAELDAIYALFNANNLPIANLQFLSLQSVPYSGYQEQVTAVQYFHGLPVFGNEIFLFNGGQLAPGGILGGYTGPPPSADTAGHQNFSGLRRAFLSHVPESYTEGGASNAKPFVPAASTYVNACLNATLVYLDASQIPGSTAVQNEALVKVWYVTPATGASVTYYPKVFVEDGNGFAWGQPMFVP